MKAYAGIGSRRTPMDIQVLMTKAAIALRKKGWILRSGGASGADTAFERGAGGDREIFYADDATNDAIDLALSFHPTPGRLSSFARRLHGRNAFQILGQNLDDPVQFVMCWTPDGCERHEERTIDTGGTGTAISIASSRGIPVFNLQRESTLKIISEKLNIQL